MLRLALEWAARPPCRFLPVLLRKGPFSKAPAVTTGVRNEGADSRCSSPWHYMYLDSIAKPQSNDGLDDPTTWSKPTFLSVTVAQAWPGPQWGNQDRLVGGPLVTEHLV